MLNQISIRSRKIACSHLLNRGAVLMELAIGLPVFLLLVYLIIWLGVMLNARASLGNAMANSLRLAATRSNAVTTGKNILPEIDSWVVSRGTIPEAAKSILLIGVPEEAPGDYLNRYLSCLLDWDGYYSSTFPSLNPPISAFTDLPASYIYSLAYLNEAMSRSIGGGLKTPCRPSGAGDMCSQGSYPPSSADGPGCLACRFISPYNSSSGAPPLQSLPTGQIEWECAYEPDNIISRPLRAFLGIFGGGNVDLLTVRRRATFSTGYVHGPS